MSRPGWSTLINFLQQQPDWDSTAVIIAYDDSDGWYDHAFAPTTHPSFSTADALNGAGICGAVGATEPTGVNGLPVAGRCGPGTRQPFLVISPYAKKNYVSHVLITQASIPQFIEDNWLNGERIGGGSFDATTGSIVDMFNFNKANSDGADPRSDLRHRGYQDQVQERLSSVRCYIARSCGCSAPALWPAPSSLPSRKHCPAKTRIRSI